MKNQIVSLLLAIVPFIAFSQKSDLSQYNNTINKVKEEVTYFKIEKINAQFYMLVGGGGNVGVFINDKKVMF